MLDEAAEKCKSMSSSLKTVELNELAADNTSSYYGRYWTGSHRFNKYLFSVVFVLTSSEHISNTKMVKYTSRNFKTNFAKDASTFPILFL